MNLSQRFFSYTAYALALMFLFSLCFAPAHIIHAQGTQNPDFTISLDNPLNDDIDSITEFVQLVVDNIVLPIGSVVVVLVFIYAGFLFVTAQGNESKLETAKHTFWWAIIGTAILLGSYVLTSVIQETVCQIGDSETPGCQ